MNTPLALLPGRHAGGGQRSVDDRRFELTFRCIVAGWYSVITQAERIRDDGDRGRYLAERRDHTLRLLDRLRAEANALDHDADELRLIEATRDAVSMSRAAP